METEFPAIAKGDHSREQPAEGSGLLPDDVADHRADEQVGRPSSSGISGRLPLFAGDTRRGWGARLVLSVTWRKGVLLADGVGVADPAVNPV
ncbi:MAG: hypothetical protein ACLP50_24825, partial [Solirubrobacteraceae bacterium]